MSFLYFVIFIVLSATLSISYYSNKMYDPYGIKMMWGKIGCGKSTYVTKLALEVFEGKHRPYFKRVYCNMAEVPNTYYFSLSDLIEVNRSRDMDDYLVPFEYGSIVCVDEASLFMNNRDYKSFSKYLQFLFRKCRHYGLYIIVLSQAFDTDKVTRVLAKDMSVLHKVFNCITIEKPIYMTLGVGETGDGMKPTELYDMGGFFSWKFTFIPKYVSMFDSYERKVINESFPMVYYAPSDDYRSSSAIGFMVRKVCMVLRLKCTLLRDKIMRNNFINKISLTLSSIRKRNG